MAGDWIKVECVTPDKPEISLIAEALAIDEDAVTGKLVRLWIWADQQSSDGNALSVTDSFLDRITFCKGFTNALRNVGWIVGESGAVTFPNFDLHNGKSAKKRAQTNRRVSASRSKVKASAKSQSPKPSECNATENNVGENCNAESVTESERKALPEKRREEKSNISTHTNERVAPEIVDCENLASSMAPPAYSDFAQSIGRGFYGIYAAQQWRTTGGADILKNDAWKHKLRSYLENELRTEISRQSSRKKYRQNDEQPNGRSRANECAAGAGINVPIL